MLRNIMIFILLLPVCSLSQENWGEPQMLESPYWNDIAGLYGLYNPTAGANDSLLFFNHWNYDYGTNTAYSFFENGQWQEPISFSYNTDESFFHLGQDTILYFSAMHNYGYGGTDIWLCRLQNGQWQPAINLGPVVNTEADESSPTVSQNRSRLCFQRDGVIMCSEIVNGDFTEPVALPDYINTDQIETHPMLYPDGTRLFFNRAPDQFNYNPDLIYVTYYLDGLWQQPSLLNDNINFYLSNNPFYGFSYKPSFSLGGTRMYFGHVEFTELGEIMMSIWISELATSVEESGISLPDAITILAYPNPFNAETSIYIFGDIGRVNEVAIYDITGALVRTLAVDSQLTWDGTNGSGKAVASGLYFVKVAGESILEVEKLTLLR